MSGFLLATRGHQLALNQLSAVFGLSCIQSGKNSPGQSEDSDVGVAVLEATPKLKKPPMYKVIMLNDDYTPMEFVVHTLQYFFGMDLQKATQIMLAIHTGGSGVCGIYPRDIAETKSANVNDYAQENKYPLMSRVEVTD